MSHFARSLPIEPRGKGGYRLETIRPGADLAGANGINFGPDGRLWVCEAFAQRVSSCDAKTGEIRPEIPRDGSLIAPDDLAFDSVGTAYITDSSRITARRVDGTLFTLTDQLISSNGITVDREDRLYVNEFRPGGRVMELDRATGAMRVIVASVDYPNACAKGPDGRLYFQNVIAGQILALDTDSGAITEVASGYQQISSVKIDPSGAVVFSEAMRGLVHRLDPASGVATTIARMPKGGIDNLTFDGQGTMYVSSYSTGCILRVPPDGSAEILVPPGLTSISSVAPLSDGAFLVANTLSATAVAADGNFDDWSTWTAPTWNDMVLGAWPSDTDDAAYILTVGGQVYRCRRDATFYDVKAALDRATGEAQLVTPEGATTLGGSDGAVYVALTGGDVSRIGSDGTLEKVANTGQAAIAAIAISNGTIAAADAEAGTIVIVKNGTASRLDGFARPTGVALDGKALFVAEHRTRRILHCDLVSGQRKVVADELPFGWPVAEPPPFGRAALLGQPGGGLVVACDGDGSIRRLVLA